MNDKERDILKQNILEFLSAGAPGEKDKFGEEMTSAFIQYIDGCAGITPKSGMNGSDAPPKKSSFESIIAGGIDLTQDTAQKAVKAEREKFLKKLQQIYQRIDSARDRQEIPEDVTEYELTVYFSQFLGDETAEEIPEAETVKKAAEQIKSDRAVYDGIAKRLVKAMNVDGGPDEKEIVTLLCSWKTLKNGADITNEFIHEMSNAEENDIFLFDALTVHPENAAAAADISKAVLTRAARAAALYLTKDITIVVSRDHNLKKPAAEIGEHLREIVSHVYEPEDTTKDVLDTLPKTLEYLREHAPELAADLEAHARREVEAAFSSLTEYVENYGREPVEKETPRPNEKTIPVNVRHDPIDKHTNNAFRGVLTDQFQQFKMERDKDTELHPVTSQVRLFMDPEKADDIKLLFGGEIKLTEREQLLYWAMCSIWEAGNRWTTYEQIARVMNCDVKKSSKKKKYHKGVSNALKHEIDTMLAKLGAMRIEAYLGEEIDRFKLKGLKRTTKGNLLYTRVQEHRIDGVNVPDAIHIFDRPILLEYSLARGQIANIPFVLLDPPSKLLKKTPEAIAIGNILIHWLYWKDVYFYELTYEEIYARRGIDPADKSASARMKRKRIRDTVDKWLTYWRNTLQVIPPYKNDLHSIRMKFPKTMGRDKRHTIFTTETIRRLKDM